MVYLSQSVGVVKYQQHLYFFSAPNIHICIETRNGRGLNTEGLFFKNVFMEFVFHQVSENITQVYLKNVTFYPSVAK